MSRMKIYLETKDFSFSVEGKQVLAAKEFRGFLDRIPELQKTISRSPDPVPDVPKPKGPILQKTHT